MFGIGEMSIAAFLRDGAQQFARSFGLLCLEGLYGGRVLQLNMACPGGVNRPVLPWTKGKGLVLGRAWFSISLQADAAHATSPWFRCRALYLSGRYKRGAGHSIGQSMLGKGSRTAERGRSCHTT
jgi:hypothetical protein